MPCTLPPSTRDVLVRLFRAEVYRRTGFVEFPHQAEFRLATEGMALTAQVAEAPLGAQKPIDPLKTKPEDYALQDTPVQLLVSCERSHPDAFEIGETGNYGRHEWRLATPRTHVLMTDEGPQLLKGVIAHRASDLASFKAGKSKSIGMWATGFACLPGACIDMLGLTYETSAHEFTYLTDALLTGEKPIIKKYKHFYNDVRGGRMWLELNNNCSFGVRSWKNKDALRGGQITCYIFNEIYQLPGFHVYTGHAQNLRAEKGYAVFTSTPDEPWVKVLHTMAHGANPEWHCSCESNAYVNPFTFDLNAFMTDVPDWDTIKEFAPGLLTICKKSGLQPGGLMSQEKFKISWLGQMGGYVGRVYNFVRDAVTCNPYTHAHIFKASVVKAWQEQEQTLERLRAHAR